MNIYINGRFLSQTITGVQRYAFQVVRTLDHLIEVDQINNKDHGFKLIAPKNVIHSIGIRHIAQEYFGYTTGHIWEQVELPTRTKANLLWNLANTGPIFGKNQVVTIHDASPLDHPEWFNPAFSQWYRFLLPRLMKNARTVITDSQYSKHRLLKYTNIPPSKINVIYPGVDDSFQPASGVVINQIREKFSLSRRYLFVVGSLEPRKNLGNLINAWGKINKGLADIELVIAGGVGRAFRSSGMITDMPQIRFIGYVNDADLRVLYSGALAFIYPSLYEGFGLPPLEAMACGAPVISSNTTSLPEAVGDAALLIDPNQINSIADSIRMVCDDRHLRDRLIIKGFSQIRKFSWDQTVLTIYEIIRSSTKNHK